MLFMQQCPLKIYFLYRLVFISIALITCTTAFGQDMDNLKLKDYRPVSIYKVPQTKIEKAKFPVIDFHSHDYPKSDAEVDSWVRRMDEANISKTLILSYATGAKFDSVVNKYSRYKDRFVIFFAGLIIPDMKNKDGKNML